MIALLTLYDNLDRDEILTWHVEVVDLTTARRVVRQLHRRHVADGCADCAVNAYTISTKSGSAGLWKIMDVGTVPDASDV